MEGYGDYVIKDGKFIGKFEEMYQKFDDPWHQLSEVNNSYSRLDTVLSLKKLNASSVLEVGCGLGGFANYLTNELPDVKIVGMDVSETAVKKAAIAYPNIEFVVGDVSEIDKVLAVNDYDVIILSEIMWYILPELEKIVAKLKESFGGKCVIINQTFYKEKQEYGRDYFTNLEEMISYMKMEVVGYTTAFTVENKISYETHCILRV